MIREFHLADWFTLATRFCGVGALFSAMSYLATQDVVRIYFAAALVLAALILMCWTAASPAGARKKLGHGRELDSLAGRDLVWRGPAIIAYGCGMQGLYDRVVLAYGGLRVSRLARCQRHGRNPVGR